jgi:magnesium-transporting ATPase (P-type)
VLTIWCAVSGPPGGHAKTSPARMSCRASPIAYPCVNLAVERGRPDPSKTVYSVDDERDRILAGYIGFLDPPRDSAQPALQALAHHGVAVKVLTGDNDFVARKICREVGLEVEGVLRGGDIDALDDAALTDAAAHGTVFAKLNPLQKSRIVRVLKTKGHTVGFLGDGINDAPALPEADIGIASSTTRRCPTSVQGRSLMRSRGSLVSSSVHPPPSLSRGFEVEGSCR